MVAHVFCHCGNVLVRNCATREGDNEATWWKGLENNQKIWFLWSFSYEAKRPIIFQKQETKISSNLPSLYTQAKWKKNIATEKATLLEMKQNEKLSLPISIRFLVVPQIRYLYYPLYMWRISPLRAHCCWLETTFLNYLIVFLNYFF